MRKKFPKAIDQTIDDLRRAKPNLRDETKSTRVSLASIPSPDGGRAGDVLAEEVRKRLPKADSAVAATVNQPSEPADAARRPAKVDAPAAVSSEKPAVPEKP